MKGLDQAPRKGDFVIGKVGTTRLAIDSAEARAFMSLLYLSGRRATEVLLLDKQDLKIEGDSLLVTWYTMRLGVKGPAKTYPAGRSGSEDEQLLMNVLAHWKRTADGPLFPGRSWSAWQRQRPHRLMGRTSLMTTHTWLKTCNPSWTARLFRVSAVYRFWKEGGLERVRERTNIVATSLGWLQNPFISTTKAARSPLPVTPMLRSTT